MYCKNCGKEVGIEEKFCSNCGQPINDNKLQSNKVIIDEENFEVTYKEGIGKIIIKSILLLIVLWICLFFEIDPYIPSSVFSVLGMVIVVAFLILIYFVYSVRNRNRIGKCPYCKSQIKTNIKNVSCICPVCRKNIVIRDEKFMQINN